MEYDSATKKNQTESFAETRMDIEIIKLSELSQKEKSKYGIPTAVSCNIFLFLCAICVVCLISEGQAHDLQRM